MMMMMMMMMKYWLVTLCYIFISSIFYPYHMLKKFEVENFVAEFCRYPSYTCKLATFYCYMYLKIYYKTTLNLIYKTFPL